MCINTAMIVMTVFYATNVAPQSIIKQTMYLTHNEPSVISEWYLRDNTDMWFDSLNMKYIGNCVTV